MGLFPAFSMKISETGAPGCLSSARCDSAAFPPTEKQNGPAPVLVFI